MSIYAIADLHLSGEPPSKPMDVFGAHWAGHKEKVKQSWLQTVQPDDVVIIAGDISWALGLLEAAEDLAWIAQLPGRKILLRGNHDYWWASPSKLRAAYGNDFEFLQNNAIMVGNVAICGTRGWVLPSAEGFNESDRKIYDREVIRLDLSLQEARARGAKRVVVAMHYPPLFAADEETGFTLLMESYGVSDCVYGHIHGEEHVITFEGERNGVAYKLVSCDTQGFMLYKVL